MLAHTLAGSDLYEIGEILIARELDTLLGGIDGCLQIGVGEGQYAIAAPIDGQSECRRML